MSSAYKSNSHLTACGMSFIYKKNRSGPKIDPWGTPHKNCRGSKKGEVRSVFLFFLFLHEK